MFLSPGWNRLMIYRLDGRPMSRLMIYRLDGHPMSRLMIYRLDGRPMTRGVGTMVYQGRQAHP
jgi:hypothetical protein